MEAQQEDAGRARPTRPPMTAEQAAAAQRRDGLQLARRRAAEDLSRVTATAHRAMLERAITALDEQLAEVERELRSQKPAPPA